MRNYFIKIYLPVEIISAIPLKRYPLRENGSTILISIAGLHFKFSTVCGECISAKARYDSSNTMIVPLGDRFGVLSADIVATYPSF